MPETFAQSEDRAQNLVVLVRDQVQTQWLPQEWVKEHLPTSNWLAENGLSFTNAYTNTSMCTSSRATFFTGKFPAQHQVKNLLDENHLDNSIIQNQIQLDPRLPNLGSLFAETGKYDVVYFGKNHIQKAIHLEEIQDESGNTLRPASIAYQNLNEFGFSDWLGKDAGGDAGSQNFGGGDADWDTTYLNRAKEWLEDRRESGSNRPYVMVVSLINPHDVLAYNNIDDWIKDPNRGGYPQDFWTDAGIKSLPPTVDENKLLNRKPPAQSEFQLISNGQQIIQTKQQQLEYLNFYARLQARADKQLGEVIAELRKDKTTFDDTLIVNTTDHGDMSMSHGGMTQKMFNVYEETANIPLTFSNERLFGQGEKFKTSQALVSHVDFLPTIASYFNLEPESIEQADLRGVDYSSILDAAAAREAINYKNINVQDNILFTYDDIWFGNDPDAFGGPVHGTLPSNNRIQSIISKDFKYARYYSQDYNADERASGTWNLDSGWFGEFYDLRPNGGDYLNSGQVRLLGLLPSTAQAERVSSRFGVAHQVAHPYGRQISAPVNQRGILNDSTYLPTPLEMKNLDPITGAARRYGRSNAQVAGFHQMVHELTQQVEEKLQPLIDPITGQITTSNGAPEAPIIYHYNEGIEYASTQDNTGSPSDAYTNGQQIAQLFDTGDSGGRKVLEIAFTTRFGQDYKVVGQLQSGEISVLDLYTPDNQVNSTEYQETHNMFIAGTNGPTVQYRYVPGNVGLSDIGIWWGADNSVVWVDG